MADNVIITPGTGNTVAADEVVDGTLGTVKVQYVKLMDGTLDSTTKISPSTSGKQDTGNTSVASIDTKTPSLGQALAASSVPVTLTALEEGLIGALTETAPGSDTASSGLNGRLQRIAQRITSLISAVGSPFQAGGSIGNTTFASTIADGADITLGAKADAKSTATDTTAITIMQVLKQISASVQAPPSQAVTNTVLANGAGKTIVSKSGSASSSGNNTIVAAGTNKLKVFAFSLTTSSTTALTVKFQDGASGTDLWSVLLQAPTSITTGANLAVSPPAWLFNTSAATLLNLNISSANAVQWSVSYYDEA